MRPILRSLAATAILTATAACGHVVPAPRPVPFYQPEVALRDVRLRGVGLIGGALDVWMRVYNPNPYDLVSPRVRYIVMVDREQVATGFSDLDVVVPARDSAEVLVPAAFRYADLGHAGRAILGRGAAVYRVVGRITVGTPYGRFSFPYDRVGQYGVMDARVDRPRRDRDAWQPPRREHGEADDDRDEGRGQAAQPAPRDRRDAVPDPAPGRRDARDARDQHGRCREAPSSDRGVRDDDRGCADAPREAPANGREPSAPGDAAPPRDTPRGPEHHQPMAHEPEGRSAPIGHPGEARKPAPVRPSPVPGRVEHPPVEARPVHPGNGEPLQLPRGVPVRVEARPVHPDNGQPAQPPDGRQPTRPTDSSAPKAPRRAKPCPPPEPRAKGSRQQEQHEPPPCVAPDSSVGKSRHPAGRSKQR